MTDVEKVIQDTKNIGTKDYKGLAFFGWNQKYKDVLRNVTPEIRKQVHNTWVREGLDLGGVSWLQDSSILVAKTIADFKNRKSS